MNRVLLSLSLSNNKITDKGAIKLGEVFSRFPLTHAEVVERRKLLRDKGSPDRTSGKSVCEIIKADSTWCVPSCGGVRIVRVLFVCSRMVS